MKRSFDSVVAPVEKPVEKLLLRVSEVIEATGLLRSTVYALISSGIIASIRIGKAIRVPTGALHGWIARLCKMPPTAVPASIIEDLREWIAGLPPRAVGDHE